MKTLVAEMTKEELVQIIESIFERKLQEMFDNFDEVELRSEVVERLHRQKALVDHGERGKAFADVIQQLDLG